MKGCQENLSVDLVELDRENPRIRRFLEDYEGELNDDRIALALDVGADTGEDGTGATSPDKLRNSILANKGIMQPIIVNRLSDGRLVCIEGNTRLWIYRDFNATGIEGDWSSIPAIVHDGLEGFEVDAIRLQAHLVGPRAWDAYSKAKYQWELHFKHLMPLDRLVDLCGGDRRDVQRSINAYADMENHFRKLFEPGEDYKTERYSGFVELQSPKVKTAILKAGFNLDDFAMWIKDERIKGLINVRQLPRVLADKKTRDIFVKRGIRAALDAIEKPEVNSTLREASIGQLARVLSEKLDAVQWADIKRMRESVEDDTLRYLFDAQDGLVSFLADFEK